MEQILEVRETFVGFYKRYEAAILILAKFLVGLIVFGQVTGIGFYMPMLSFVASIRLPLVLLLAVLFTMLPMSVGYGLIILTTALHTSAAIGITGLITAFLSLIVLFYARLAPRENFLILAMYFGYMLGIPFLVPILAGLYLGMTSVIPIAIGVMIWSLIPLLGALIEETIAAEAGIADLAGYVEGLYTALFSELWANEGWVFTAFIMVMVNVVVFAISRLSLNHAKEVAIGTGVVVAVVSSVVAHIIAEPAMGLFASLVSAVISGLFAYMVSFFDMVLDYRRAERVQFEDEHNFYQVRIIPKIGVSRSQEAVPTYLEEDAAMGREASELGEEDDTPGRAYLRLGEGGGLGMADRKRRMPGRGTMPEESEKPEEGTAPRPRRRHGARYDILNRPDEK